MSRRTLRPRPFDNKKKLSVVHDAAGLELADETIVRSIANRNTELEKNNDKVVTVAAKNGEEVVPVPGFRAVTSYEQLYPNDFKHKDDMNAEYLTSGKNLLPMESHAVEYAADSEDDDWLEANMNTEGQERLSTANFEKLIWKLELANSMVTQHFLRKAGASMMERKSKGSSTFIQQFSKTAAVKLLRKHEGFESALIERVYDYWIRKRRFRKEPLLRTLQPKTAANDRDPDHTFREREKVKRPNTRRRRHVNRGDNVEEKLSEIKDEMGHVCNILKSMINRESVKAHVVNIYIAQKRQLLDKLSCEEGRQPSRLPEIQREQRKKERYLKREDAEYRAKICRLLLQNVFHGQLRKMFASARGTEGEGGCEAAITRRLRKAQKRRQKVISFLVQDRNWQKWHDKTWMQKMYVILKKRTVLGKVSRYFQQKRTWKKWEEFVKTTRDHRLRKMMDLAQKRKFPPSKPPKQSKQIKTVMKPSTDVKAEPSKSAADGVPRKKPPTRPASASMLDGKDQQGEISATDAASTEAVAESTVSWAQRQGVAPPKAPTVSKTITIPSAFVVPQNGFSCLPPRLKEMYSEAEKDAMQPPDQVCDKMKAMKGRRRRIHQLMSDAQFERSDAVAQQNEEWKRASHLAEKKREMQSLQHQLLRTQRQYRKSRVQRSCAALLERDQQNDPMNEEVTSGRPGMDASDDPGILEELKTVSIQELSPENYPQIRHKLLKFLKTKIHSLTEGSIESTKLSRDKRRLQMWLGWFWKLKDAKIPNLRLLETLLKQVTTVVGLPEISQEPATHSMEISDDDAVHLGQRKRKRSKNRSSSGGRLARSIQEADSMKAENTGEAVKKRVSLVKRQNRRLVLEIRLNGQNRVIPLEPGADFQLNPFTPNGRELDSNQLQRCLESTEEPVKATEREASVPTDQTEPMEVDGVGGQWNGVCSRDGPVAQVPVHSHRMIKTQSAPVLVPSEDYYPSPSQNKPTEQRKRISIGLGISKRLVKGKGGSVSALRKRQRLRRQMLKPLGPKTEVRKCLPKTKLCKLQALSKVKMQVPSRPERRQLFSYVFKLNRAAPLDKAAESKRLPAWVPPEVTHTGLTRIGRGSRVWVDRVDPMSRQRLDADPSALPTATHDLLPTLRKVLEADQTKKALIQRRSVQRSLSKKRMEERKAQKLNQMQESATQLANRQQSFLPHCVLQVPREQEQKKEEKTCDKKREVDAQKEAQRLYGMALEMGVQLPLEQLIQATAASCNAALTGQETALPAVGASDPKAVKIKSEPLECINAFQADKQQDRPPVVYLCSCRCFTNVCCLGWIRFKELLMRVYISSTRSPNHRVQRSCCERERKCFGGRIAVPEELGLYRGRSAGG